MQALPPTDRPSRFPLSLELLVWGLYVGLYKYSFYLEDAAALHQPARALFPYPQLMLFALLATLYVLPYYRWLVPRLLRRRRYALLAVGSLLYLWWGIKVNTWLAAALLSPVAAPPVLAEFYQQLMVSWQQVLQAGQPHLQLLLTDALAFGCVAFGRFAFENEQRRRHLERDHLALQLAQLKAQLQPHFLFNTLNSLSALVMSGRADRAEEMLMALSTFFRTSLSLDPSADVTLAQEIDLQRLYLDIEKIRFPERLRFEIDVPDDLAGVTVPALILQPLVENAIKYGVSATRDPVLLTIVAQRLDGGRAQIDVTNRLAEAGPTKPAASPAHEGTGVGLANVCNRLEAHYGDRADCRFGPIPGGYKVSIAFPIDDDNDDD